MIEEFKEILAELEEWLQDESLKRIKSNEDSLKPIEIKLMGQFSLLLTLPNEKLNATSDLDAVIKGDAAVKQFLKDRLLQNNLVVDEDAELIQMPKGTKWISFYKGRFISVLVAAPEYVAASKCQFKRLKDKTQLRALLKKFPEWNTLLEALAISTEWLNEK